MAPGHSGRLPQRRLFFSMDPASGRAHRKEAPENSNSMRTPYDPTTSAPVSAIVRAAVIVVTLALFAGSMANAALGFRDIAVLLALAAPLGISAWGFVRAGYNEAAMGLLCCVLIVVITLILALNPLGV